MKKKGITILIGTLFFLVLSTSGYGAYHHMGEADSDTFLAVYPDKAGTKLDSCNLCHSGGQYQNNKGVWVRVVKKANYKSALKKLEKDLLKKVDGCVKDGSPHRNDWITACPAQRQIYWAAHEIAVLLDIAVAEHR